MYSFEDKSVISLDNIEMEALYSLLMAMVDTDDPSNPLVRILKMVSASIKEVV